MFQKVIRSRFKDEFEADYERISAAVDRRPVCDEKLADN